MKKLFTAITKNDVQTVRTLLNKSPDLIHCVSKAPPKKHDGQSPLQVALKTARTEMIELLLTYHPDVNFMESETCINEWRAPVIHDAINRAVMYSRWNINGPDGLQEFNTKQEADDAFRILQKIIRLGADVNAKDSYGNACMDRACLQARQILPKANDPDRILTDALREDLSRIFALLIVEGADMEYIAPHAFGKNYIEKYGNEAIGELLGSLHIATLRVICRTNAKNAVHERVVACFQTFNITLLYGDSSEYWKDERCTEITFRLSADLTHGQWAEFFDSVFGTENNLVTPEDFTHCGSPILNESEIFGNLFIL